MSKYFYQALFGTSFVLLLWNALGVFFSYVYGTAFHFSLFGCFAIPLVIALVANAMWLGFDMTKQSVA